MTQLLVSVRNAAEAVLAYEAGANLIDVKEPARGALGAVDPSALSSVVETLACHAPVSAALGELLDESPVLRAAELAGLTFAKFGLAGCGARSDWVELWRARIDHFPCGVVPVAVVYADATAMAPSPLEVLAAAEAVGASVVLVDTYDKPSGPLLTHWTTAETEHFVIRVHDAGLKIALAGSLDSMAIRKLLPAGPDIIAVRGAACRGGRNGPLDPSCVMRLAELLGSRQVRDFAPVLTTQDIPPC